VSATHARELRCGGARDGEGADGRSDRSGVVLEQCFRRGPGGRGGALVAVEVCGDDGGIVKHRQLERYRMWLRDAGLSAQAFKQLP